jgi:hypothetical protein
MVDHTHAPFFTYMTTITRSTAYLLTTLWTLVYLNLLLLFGLLSIEQSSYLYWLGFSKPILGSFNNDTRRHNSVTVD